MNKTRRLLLLVVSASTLLFGCNNNDIPQEGEQYQTLTTNLATFRIQPVTEIFSLTCSHCRNMESVLPELESLTEQKIGKIHVTFNHGAKSAAAIYYSAVMQLNHKPNDEMMSELFAAVQLGNDKSQQEKQAAIANVFTNHGLIPPAQLSLAQQKNLMNYVKTAEKITQQGNIQAVPTFIVAGKYQILTEGHDNVKQLAHAINYLLNPQ
ncbi:thioredoxin domain-containing protein [Vibrio sp. AK197]